MVSLLAQHIPRKGRTLLSTCKDALVPDGALSEHGQVSCGAKRDLHLACLVEHARACLHGAGPGGADSNACPYPALVPQTVIQKLWHASRKIQAEFCESLVIVSHSL